MINLLTEKIRNISSEIFDKFVALRREFHKYPELGFKEYRTSAIIKDCLTDLGIPVIANIAGTGVSGVLECGKAKKTIAIRADMDALPIEEMNTSGFVSCNKGIMHACGHDIHMAVVLGTAEVLSRLRNEINGNIKFIFQPAEEGLGGAKEMINEGILEAPKVDGIIATHVSPLLDTGSISVRPGPAMASPSDFEIVIIGKSGHAAEPHTAVDPITIASNLVNLFQSIITREKNPLDTAILSITYFHAGSSYNIIPDSAVLRGTVRTFNREIDSLISKRMEEITASLTRVMGAGYKFDYRVSYPSVVNDEGMVDQLIESASRVIPKESIVTNPNPVMLAEDFSYYAQAVPGTIFNLGCKSSDTKTIYNLHNSKFDPDENCIKTGIEIMAQYAIDYLQK
ncbi:MAG: amidohydrolase [Clostridia bacterium]|nr:amidohydrolase [Clostridia bacterium]